MFLVGKNSYEYNSLNNLIKETSFQSHLPLGGEGVSRSEINYTYDELGNTTSIYTNTGHKLNYEYDNLNRLTKVLFNEKEFVNYDLNSLSLKSVNYGNGIQTNYTYDDYFRTKTVITKNEEIIQEFNYTYDNVGNITNDGTKNYTYDEIYRITQEVGGVKEENYIYDKVGNRVQKTQENNEIHKYTTNKLNEYLKIERTKKEPANLITQTENYIYDANGNLIKGPHPNPLLRGEGVMMNYEYDYKNRLIKSSSQPSPEGEGVKVVEYNYDVLGRRIEKKISHSELVSESIKYIYAGENIFEEIIEKDGKITTKKYINGIGIDEVLGYENEGLNISDRDYKENNFCERLVKTNQSEYEEYGYTNIIDRCEELKTLVNNAEITKNLYYYHKNNNGSITALTNSSGSVVLKYEYDLYGNPYIKTGTGKYTKLSDYKGNLYNNTRLFTSREYDVETNLYYFRARYYSAELGRFISRDPIGQNDDVNLYAYVGNNSVMYVDLMGLSSKSAIGELTDVLIDGFNSINDNINYQFVDNVGNSMLGMGGTAIVVGGGMCAGSLVIGVTSIGIPIILGCTAGGGTALVGTEAIGIGLFLKMVAKEGKELQEDFHGNDKKSKKKQHLYSIFDKIKNIIYKYGISGLKLNKNGTSKRANSQVNKLNKKEGIDRYSSKVENPSISNRSEALKDEFDAVLDFRIKNGEKPAGNNRPNPMP